MSEQEGPRFEAAPQGARKSVGLRDVARVAGVSTASVSRVINRPEVVSEDLRQRITDVIDQLGWVPDAAARALTTRRSQAIGAVFPTLGQGDFARAAQVMQRELLSVGYTLLLACSEYSQEQEAQQVRKFVERGIDGLILVGNCHDPDLEAFLKQKEIPTINTYVYNRETHGRSIGPDNFKILYELTSHLIGLGHRHLGLICQTVENNDRAQARVEGFGHALADHGATAAPYRISRDLASISEARSLFREIMNENPRPTAVVCGNAYHAIGAELEALAMGIRIPEDLSIAGYDDIEIMSELPVPITTVRVSSDEIGTRAARHLVGLIENKPVDTSFECPPEIIVRSSTGPAPK